MTEQNREAAINAHIQDDAFARLLGAEVSIVAPGHSRALRLDGYRSDDQFSRHDPRRRHFRAG